MVEQAQCYFIIDELAYVHNQTSLWKDALEVQMHSFNYIFS